MSNICNFCGCIIDGDGNSINSFSYLHLKTQQEENILCCDLCNAYLAPFRNLLYPTNEKVSLEDMTRLELGIRNSLTKYRKGEINHNKKNYIYISELFLLIKKITDFKSLEVVNYLIENADNDNVFTGTCRSIEKNVEASYSFICKLLDRMIKQGLITGFHPHSYMINIEVLHSEESNRKYVNPLELLYYLRKIIYSRIIEVIYCFFENMNEDFMFIGTIRSIAKEIGVDEADISRIIKKMIEVNFIIKTHPKVYRINPNLFVNFDNFHSSYYELEKEKKYG